MNFFSSIIKSCGLDVASFFSGRAILLGAFCCFGTFGAFAQNTSTEGSETVFKQTVAPAGIDNYLFATYYHNSENSYNLRSLVLGESRGEVLSMKVNPSGTSYATLSKKGEKTVVAIYDLWRSNKKLQEFKVSDASAICYTPDAKQILIATANKLYAYDARLYTPVSEMEMPFAATKMVVSPNGYYLAATDGENITVWNLEGKNVRKKMMIGTTINDFAFSPNSSLFAVVTDGLLSIYGTTDFIVQQNIEAMGDAKSCSFHPDNKYLSVVTGDKRITVLNVMDSDDRGYVDNALGGIDFARFVSDDEKNVYLVYDSNEGLVYRRMDGLAPNYTQLLSDELGVRMTEWEKQLPGESLSDYKTRVNEETRAAQKQKFEVEIATRMADNMADLSEVEVTMGSYSTGSEMLAVSLGTMTPIYLEVPMQEVSDFAETGNVEFRNVEYGLNKQDKFIVVYADVYNRKTGKTYVYDNRGQQSPDYLASEEDFVPLDVVIKKNMEEMHLQELKDRVATDALNRSIISDHTNITVSADVASSNDANGRKVMNYQVKFAYDVEPGFSAREDFAPGKYKVQESGAAESMLTIVKNALEGEFAQYVKAGKKLQVRITGMADAMPITGNIAYDGSFGDFKEEPVYKSGRLSNISVSKKSGITTNEQLAFLRGAGVKEHLTKNILALSTMNVGYEYHIELPKGKGGQYRRITLEFTFVDAF